MSLETSRFASKSISATQENRMSRWRVASVSRRTATAGRALADRLARDLVKFLDLCTAREISARRAFINIEPGIAGGSSRLQRRRRVIMHA